MTTRPAASTETTRGGFSLIWVSIILTVGGIVLVSVLPGREAGDMNSKIIKDVDKLDRVEEGMRGFMVFNGRRPCPADGQYAPNTPNFGKEAANPGTCPGGTPAAPLGPDPETRYIVGGVIPPQCSACSEGPPSFAQRECGDSSPLWISRRRRPSPAIRKVHPTV